MFLIVAVYCCQVFQILIKLDIICSLVPCREQSSLPSKGESEIVPRKPYSPFQQFDNKADFAMARFDDLVNWARKVTCFTTENGGILFGKKHSILCVFLD